MYANKIKVHIGATLFCGLMISMVLINIVIFIFWYQHMVQQQAMKMKETVDAWSGQYLLENVSENSYETKNALSLLYQELAPECKQVLMIDGRSVTTAVDVADIWNLEEKVRNSLQNTQKEMIQIERADLSFVYSPEIVLMIFSLYEEKPEAGRVGVVYDTTAILLRLYEKEKIIIIYILLNAFILTTIAFFRMRNVLLKPIEKLVNVAENYQLSEGEGLFSGYRENEFGQLSRAMGTMVRRIEEDRSKLSKMVDSLEDANKRLKDAQQEIIHSEKLAAAGRLSAGMAHEIGNPLAIVQGYLELLQDENLDQKDRIQISGRSLEELRRIDRLLRQLMDMTRSREYKSEAVCPAALLTSLFEVLQPAFDKKNIAASFSLPKEAVAVWGDGELLRQVLLNCLLNAIDTVFGKMQGSAGGEIKVAVKKTEKAGGAKVLLAVSDNGMGIKKEDLDYIFEPFFTSKPPGKGTGLGLAVSYRIIQSLGGRIEVESEWGEGSVFRILLPMYVEN